MADDWLNQPQFKLANEQYELNKHVTDQFVLKSQSTYLFDIEGMMKQKQQEQKD